MYDIYNIDHEAIRKFVERRRKWRKISLCFTFTLFFFILTADYLYPVQIATTHRDLYHFVIIILIIVDVIISHYIGTVLSTCPLCHIVIPTIKLRSHHRTKRMVAGNGDLPDTCPYCGAPFYKY